MAVKLRCLNVQSGPLLQEERLGAEGDASHEVGIDVPTNTAPPPTTSYGHSMDGLASGSGHMISSGSGHNLLAGGSSHNLMVAHSNLSLPSNSSLHQ